MKPISTRFLCLLAALPLAPLIGQRSENTVLLDDTAVRNLRIQTVEAEERTFESTVFAIGRIEEIPASRSALSSRIAGRVTELKAFVGDTVQAGQPLATLESRQPGNPPPSVELLAPASGLIVESHVRLGQPVEPSFELLDIADRSKLWAIAKIPEREAAQTKVGTRAHIHVPALGDELIEATLTRYGVEADRQAGAIDGIFELANPDGKLRPGMRAEFSIVLDTRPDVLAVPREALQGDPAKRIVFVKDFDLPNAYLRSPVVVGAENERYVEILSGLFPGDEVVTQGSYALSFAGGGSGLSLKEALDAAHGHEHNEDGSEIVPGDHDHDHGEDDHHHEKEGEHEHGHLNGFLIAYACLTTLALLIAAQSLWKRRQPESESPDVN